jgi:hypothetical protein
MRGNWSNSARVSHSGMWSVQLKCAVVLAGLACLKPATPQQQPPTEFRVRVAVKLVQVDATVTDSHGAPVSGLAPEDFQILLDGQPQQIKFCEGTGKIGTASDFVVVPALKGLALSGIAFQRSLGVEDHVRPATGPRDYAPGERAEFALQIINAPVAPLTIRTSLFRDGAQVYETAAKPIEARASKTAGRFFTHSAIDIPSSLEPGDYLMRVDVEDQLSPRHHARAWQWARLSISAAQP